MPLIYNLFDPDCATPTQNVVDASLSAYSNQQNVDFSDLLFGLKTYVERVYEGCGGFYQAVFLGTSASCAIEAMLTTYAPYDSKTLVVCNGYYAERALHILKKHVKPYEVLKQPWSEPLNLHKIENLLRHDKQITHIMAVHHETSTGRLNDIDSLNTLCRNYNRKMLLDASTSFGAQPIDFQLWNLQALTTSAYTCLHGMPGVSIVIVEKQILEDEISYANADYLDLSLHEKYQRNGNCYSTQNIPALLALKKALIELETNGGWQSRCQRYETIANKISHALSGVGIRHLLDADVRSNITSSFHFPKGWIFTKLFNHLNQFKIVISPGMGIFIHNTFRLANMGNIRDNDIERLTAAFRSLSERKSEQNTDHAADQPPGFSTNRNSTQFVPE